MCALQSGKFTLRPELWKRGGGGGTRGESEDDATGLVAAPAPPRTVLQLVTCLAERFEVLRIQRHRWIFDVRRCQSDFVMDLPRRLPAALAQWLPLQIGHPAPTPLVRYIETVSKTWLMFCLLHNPPQKNNRPRSRNRSRLWSSLDLYKAYHRFGLHVSPHYSALLHKTPQF